jgi:hypothetical protein
LVSLYRDHAAKIFEWLHELADLHGISGAEYDNANLAQILKSGGVGGMAGFFSGFSATTHSVVRLRRDSLCGFPQHDYTAKLHGVMNEPFSQLTVGEIST